MPTTKMKQEYVVWGIYRIHPPFPLVPLLLAKCRFAVFFCCVSSSSPFFDCLSSSMGRTTIDWMVGQFFDYGGWDGMFIPYLWRMFAISLLLLLAI